MSDDEWPGPFTFSQVPLNVLCAVCKSQLEPVEAHGVTIDQCPFCHALWFDYGELEIYSENHKPLEFIGAFNGPIFTAKRGAHRRDCPRCESHSLQFGKLSRYDVWRCETCGGFFVFSETIDVLAPKDEAKKAFMAIEILLGLLSWGVR